MKTMSITGDLFLDVILNYGGTLIGLAFTVLIGIVGRPLAKHLWLKGFFERVFAEARDVVMEVNQTFVDRIRLARTDGATPGVVTPEELAEARSMAFAKLKSNLGPKLLERAARVLGYDDAGMDRLLGTKIEANVQRQNLIKSGALPPVSVDGSSTTPAPAPPRLPLPPPPPTSER